jgi:hypothetical protein
MEGTLGMVPAILMIDLIVSKSHFSGMEVDRQVFGRWVIVVQTCWNSTFLSKVESSYGISESEPEQQARDRIDAF